MKPPPFEYVAARTVEHAVELLNDGPDARVLAGGQSLMPLLNLRLASPERLVDIGRIPKLQSIEVDRGTLVIGAGVTQADAATDPQVQRGWPLLAAAIGHIGHPQIRNRGTVCGSLAHNDPLAELPAIALALEAEVVVASVNGERTVAADDLFDGPFATTIDPGELVLAARFPALPAGTGWSIREFASRSGDFATAGVVARLTVSDKTVVDAKVVLFGLGPGPQRSAVIEEAVVGFVGPDPDAPISDRLGDRLDDEVLARFDESLDPTDDVHASSAARRELAAVLVTQSVTEAWKRHR